MPLVRGNTCLLYTSENRYNSTLEMSRDLVTSLHPSHRRDAKVVFDDMTDTKTLPKVDPVPSASLEKKAVAAEPSEPCLLYTSIRL